MHWEAAFTADVSHELRTPISATRTTAELLLSQPQADQRFRFPLQRLERAGRHMCELIKVFLILAREPEPSNEETRHAYSLEPIIRDILDSRHEDLERKGLSITVDATGKPEVQAP